VIEGGLTAELSSKYYVHSTSGACGIFHTISYHAMILCLPTSYSFVI
jgi:hypothetical protein